MRKPLVFLFIHWLSLTFATNAAYCCCVDGLLFQIWIISIAFENVGHRNGKTFFSIFFLLQIMETTTISMHCMAWGLETIDFLLKIRKVLLQRCAQHIWTDSIDWQTTAAFSVGFFLLFPLWFIPNTIICQNKFPVVFAAFLCLSDYFFSRFVVDKVFNSFALCH